MTPKVNWMYIELGVPLFILSIGLSLRASQWVNMITSKKTNGPSPSILIMPGRDHFFIHYKK